jgi:uncharacterized phiE125 gp8 family phage protein
MSYIDADDVKEYVEITSSSHDAMLEGLIDSAETFIESYTGRDFKADSDSTRTLDAVDDVDGVTLWLDEDLCAITTVTTNADAAGGGTALTEDTDFVVVPKNRTPYYALKMLGSSSNTWTYTDDSELGITIAGKWGYSTTPPQDIKQAMIDIVTRMYRARGGDAGEGNVILSTGVVITPAQVPVMTMKTLDTYRKVV